MSLILNIDTALEVASASLARNGEVMAFAENQNQKEHSAWLHTAIQTMLKEINCNAHDLDAIGVNTGPGSYTGIRIGLSAAKGFCYALQKPLITVSSLELIVYANKELATDIICPVVDARRMEIYYALYNKEGLLQQPAAHILTENSFTELLSTHSILFCGTGSKKLQTIIQHPKAMFSNKNGNAKDLAHITFRKYTISETASLVEAEPLYIKDFYTSEQKR